MSSHKTSAGLLMYRTTERGLEVFLVHPGGPFYKRKDLGSWSLPKGEVEEGEEPFQVALREFEEETGRPMSSCATSPGTIPLGSIRQRSGKTVVAWAFQGNWPDHTPIHSNRFSMEWPHGSGAQREFPEVDRAEFFSLDLARKKILEAQAELLDRLVASLASAPER